MKDMVATPLITYEIRKYSPQSDNPWMNPWARSSYALILWLTFHWMAGNFKRSSWSISAFRFACGWRRKTKLNFSFLRCAHALRLHAHTRRGRLRKLQRVIHACHDRPCMINRFENGSRLQACLWLRFLKCEKISIATIQDHRWTTLKYVHVQQTNNCKRNKTHRINKCYNIDSTWAANLIGVGYQLWRASNEKKIDVLQTVWSLPNLHHIF